MMGKWWENGCWWNVEISWKIMGDIINEIIFGRVRKDGTAQREHFSGEHDDELVDFVQPKLHHGLNQRRIHVGSSL